MDVSEYLENVLKKYHVNTSKNSDGHKAGVKIYNDVIKNWGGKWILEVPYSGSRSKGTAIKGISDVDILISIDPNISDDWTLSKLYNSLYNALLNKGYKPRKQNVSINVNVNNISIDLIPAKKMKGNTNFHWLWKNKQKTRIQTNIKKQTDFVISSNRQKEIKLMKIWKKWNNVDIPTVYLELLVIKALHGKQQHLQNNIVAILKFLKDEIKTTRIVDPANTKNVISNDLSDLEKSMISLKATLSLNRKWEEDFK